MKNSLRRIVVGFVASVSLLIDARVAQATPVEVQPGLYDGYWQIGTTGLKRGPKIVDVAPGVYSFAIGVDSHATINVAANGVVTSSHASLVAAGNIVTLQTVSTAVDPELYLGYYNFYYANILWLQGQRSVNLVPGFFYRLYVGVADYVDVDLAANGDFVSTHAGLSIDQGTIRFNTVQVDVDASDYIGTWELNRGSERHVGNLSLELPIDFRYRLVFAGYGQHDFDLLTDGTVQRLSTVSLTSGVQWLRFSTSTVTLDPVAFAGLFGVENVQSWSDHTVHSLQLVPGVRYRVGIAGSDGFNVDLRAGGVWEIAEGQSADASGTLLTLRNTSVYVTPSDAGAPYRLQDYESSRTGPSQYVLVPDIRYLFVDTLGHEQYVDLLPPCLPSPSVLSLGLNELGLSCAAPVADADGDGISDSSDNCPATPNADQLDADADGLGDSCDGDMDGDGIGNALDNCPSVVNAMQEDIDGDAVGDACDDDRDGDTVMDSLDNCPYDSNLSQADLDLDGVGDVCDSDRDGDGLGNVLDNCPNYANADQADTDGDGAGDACDEDQDGDGIGNTADTCSGTEPGAKTNGQGCSAGQWLALSCDRPAFKNHGQYVRCVVQVLGDLKSENVISEDERKALMKEAAKP